MPPTSTDTTTIRSSASTEAAIELDMLEKMVRDVVAREPICDMHTHLYPPIFGTPVPNRTGRTDASGLMLWGIDELVTYHYLIAEVFRVVPSSQLPYETFWSWPKQRQADHIWQYLFIDNTPLSEACRGILTVLTRLGLDPNEKSLSAYRFFFNRQTPDEYIDRVMELSNVKSITMTNAVFDDNERNRWLSNPPAGNDRRFRAVLRIDPLVRNYPHASEKLRRWGYQADFKPTPATLAEVRRFLSDWLDRQSAIYVAMSLPPEFLYPAPTADPVAAAGQCVLEEAILPVCAERKLPLALMIGSSLQTNPALRDAGDTVSKGDVPSVGRLCRNFPNNKFLVTMLSRENQHELCVTARKFGNLMPFGCWWFLNNPSLIAEITEMRFELLGRTFVPQHSDARILDQLIYKWDHSREIIAGVLTEMYRRTARTGRKIRLQDIQRDTTALFSGNFEAFLADR